MYILETIGEKPLYVILQTNSWKTIDSALSFFFLFFSNEFSHLCTFVNPPP